MSSTQLQDELERSFGDGPPPAPVADHLVSGRRALRRRRVALAACALVLVGGVGYAVSGTGPAERSTGFAEDPTPTPTPAPQVVSPPWDAGSHVRYRDGAFEVRPGVVVHERVEDPTGEPAPRDSLGLDLTFEGQRVWLLAEYDGEALSTSESVPSNGWASFADWLDTQAGQSAPGADGWPVTLVQAADGSVVAGPGSKVLQRTDDPRLGPSFAAPGEPTGAAVVRAPEGESYFVVWRVVDGELDVITTPPADVVGATFAELLSYARAQYAGGEGLR